VRLFENLIINEFIKTRNFNRGENRQPYFWQDNHSKEIRLPVGEWEKITVIEMKAGKTISTSYFDNLKYWRSLAALPEEQGYVVYGGEQSMANQRRDSHQLAAFGSDFRLTTN